MPQYAKRTKKRFGQHFLHDQSVIGQIIAALAPSRGEKVVEIGPGSGALTFPLLKQLDHLQIVEVDKDLIHWWQQQPVFKQQLTLHAQDALTLDIEKLKGQDDTKLRFIGNLPYNISTPLIFELLQSSIHIRDMLFMLQKEVVERMTAAPGSKNYGRLSVMVQYHCQAESLLAVPPAAFDPPPKVDSAVVHLIPWEKLPHPALDYTQFNRLVTRAFAHKRKTLRNNLKQSCDMTQLEQLDIDPAQRAETLPLGQFVALSNLLSQNKSQ